MDAIRTVNTVILITLVSFIGTSFASCNTPQSPSPEEVRKHTDAGFDRLGAEERANKHRSGYGQ